MHITLSSNAFSLKVASRVTLDPLQLARVRLARVECLAGGGFPAEAASALAAVLTGGGTPKTTGDYAGRRCHIWCDISLISKIGASKCKLRISVAGRWLEPFTHSSLIKLRTLMRIDMNSWYF